MQAVQDVVEHLVERDGTDITTLGGTQIWTDMVFKLLFGYTGRDGAHGGELQLEFFTYHAALSPFWKV
ncbi:MAG: hypothetical protein RML33_11445 [Acidobacteriota bacterium]|nr:hypothetical protein [Acidobacteriota bacterium]